MINLTSQKQYLGAYLGLVKKVGSNDKDKICKYILAADIKDTTKLSYLNAIVGLKKIDPSLIPGHINDIKEIRDGLNFKVEKEREKNNTNPRQARALRKVSLEDINEFVERLNEKKNESTKDLDKYILIKMMTKYPVRNDLQEILLTKIKKDLDQPTNCLYIPTGKNKSAILSIKEYKTARSNGDIDITLEPELSNDIRNLIKDKREYLFINNKKEPLSSASFSQRMNKIFKDEFKVPISSTILRKIYLTGKYAKVAAEMEADSKIMGHDISTQRKIYIKRKDGKIDTNPTKEDDNEEEEKPDIEKEEIKIKKSKKEKKLKE